MSSKIKFIQMCYLVLLHIKNDFKPNETFQCCFSFKITIFCFKVQKDLEHEKFESFDICLTQPSY